MKSRYYVKYISSKTLGKFQKEIDFNSENFLKAKYLEGVLEAENTNMETCPLGSEPTI